VTDVNAIVGGAHLASLIAGFAPPRRKFEIEMLRADSVTGAPVTVNATFAVRALSAGEMEEAHAEAIKWLVSKGGHQREDLIGATGDSMLELELMTQLLARALMHPDRTREPAVKDAAMLRDLMFSDEIEACFREYTAFQAERSPLRNIRSADELREVVDALGKGRGSSINLLRFDVISLRNITLSLADRVVTLTRPSFSDTSQPNASPADYSETQEPATNSLSISEE
jgi:hypothetical protein